MFLVHQEEEKRLMAKTPIAEQIARNNSEEKTCTEAFIAIKEITTLILYSIYEAFPP